MRQALRYLGPRNLESASMTAFSSAFHLGVIPTQSESLRIEFGISTAIYSLFSERK